MPQEDFLEDRTYVHVWILVLFNNYKWDHVKGKNSHILREDTHKKKVFFSVGTTKGVGRVNPPPTTKQRTTFFSKIWLFYPKNWEAKEKIVKIRFRVL